MSHIWSFESWVGWSSSGGEDPFDPETGRGNRDDEAYRAENVATGVLLRFFVHEEVSDQASIRSVSGTA